MKYKHTKPLPAKQKQLLLDSHQNIRLIWGGGREKRRKGRRRIKGRRHTVSCPQIKASRGCVAEKTRDNSKHHHVTHTGGVGSAFRLEVRGQQVTHSQETRVRLKQPQALRRVNVWQERPRSTHTPGAEGLCVWMRCSVTASDTRRERDEVRSGGGDGRCCAGGVLPHLLRILKLARMQLI